MMERDELVERMAEQSLWTADDWRRILDAAATGAKVDDLLRATAPRTWVGEALAAYDQSVSEAGAREGFPGPDFWVSRAQAAAAIASAEQARIANLIAFKALQADRSAGPFSAPLAGDAITEQIEQGLGL